MPKNDDRIWIIIPKKDGIDGKECAGEWCIGEKMLAVIFHAIDEEATEFQWVSFSSPSTDNPPMDSWRILIVNQNACLENLGELLKDIKNPFVFVHFGAGILADMKGMDWIHSEWKKLTRTLGIDGLPGVCDWPVMPYSRDGNTPWHSAHLKEVSGAIWDALDCGVNLEASQDIEGELNKAWKQASDYFGLTLPSLALAKCSYSVNVAATTLTVEGEGREANEGLRAALMDAQEGMEEVRKRYQAACDLLCAHKVMIGQLEEEKPIEKTQVKAFIDAFKAFSQQVSTLVKEAQETP